MITIHSLILALLFAANQILSLWVLWEQTEFFVELHKTKPAAFPATLITRIF